MLTNNRAISGIITAASYYEKSERHKGANEGGEGPGCEGCGGWACGEGGAVGGGERWRWPMKAVSG